MSKIIVKTKSRGAAIVLCLFLGGFGAHKFYLGNNKVGFLYMIFCWTGIPLIMSIGDLVVLLLEDETSFMNTYTQRWERRGGELVLIPNEHIRRVASLGGQPRELTKREKAFNRLFGTAIGIMILVMMILSFLEIL